MTDSMKFGPGWLRNLSADSANPNLLPSSNQSSSSGTNPGPNSATFNSTSGGGIGGGGQSQSAWALFGNTIGGGGGSSSSAAYTPAPRNQFPEFRYGREEMLSLFDKNFNMPDILPAFKKIFVEKVQFPLALTPSTDEELSPQIAVVPTVNQRPSWIQRSPVGFSSSTRGLGRGGSVDRGRMRGKSGYHQIYQRPTAMFEDDLRSVSTLKGDRGWPERNGAGDSLGVGGGGNSSSGLGGSSGGGGMSDWNGAPASPRKEFSNHPRNMENWRRNRGEDSSSEGALGGGGSGGGSGLSGNGSDGWRAGGGGAVSSGFGSTHRWGRSTSWRDEDISPLNAVDVGGGYPSGSGITMQRSYSTITTVNERGGYMSSSGNGSSVLGKTLQSSASYTGGNNPNRLSGLNMSAGRSRQWNNSNNMGTSEGDDNLPEWAMENPTDGGGTFDASGAFHGSVDEDDNAAATPGNNIDAAHRTSANSGDDSSGSISTNNSSSKQDRKRSTSGSEKAEESGVKNEEKLEANEGGDMRTTPDSGEVNEAPHNEERHSAGDKEQGNNEVRGVKTPSENQKADKGMPGEMSTEATAAETSTSSYMESSPTIAAATIDEKGYFGSKEASKNSSLLANENGGNLQQPASQQPHDFPDRMQEVADDMIEKLIMDDDAVIGGTTSSSSKDPNEHNPSSQDPTLTTTAASSSLRTSSSFVSPGLAAILKQNVPHHPPMQSPPILTDASPHKGIPLYGGGLAVDHATLQQHHHLQQVAVAANLASNARLPPAAAVNSTDLWYYRDPQSKVQGPFNAMEMAEWYRAGYFNENLYVRRHCDRNFRALGELIKLCHENMPFTHSHLLPAGLDSLPVPNVPAAGTRQSQKPQMLNDYMLKQHQQQQNEQREELNFNVAATADYLSHAVKNLSPVEVSHVLSVNFQMLQNRYLRHQEICIFNELSKNECFQQLPAPEKEAVVRQKLQHHAMPEYLTSLTGLNNTLASVNPSVGNQLYDALVECSKKEHIFGGGSGGNGGGVTPGNAANASGNPGPHPPRASPFMDAADNFLLTAQQQQLSSQFTGAPYSNVLSGGGDSNPGAKLSPSDMPNSELLNNFNLRMFMTANPNANTSQIPHTKPQDFTGSEFLNEPLGPVHSASAPLVAPLWYTNNPSTQSAPPQPQVPPPQQQPQHTQLPAAPSPVAHSQNTNQWSNNLMVSGFAHMQNMSNNGIGQQQTLQQQQPKVMPSSMWDLPLTAAASAAEQQIQQGPQQQQQVEFNATSFDEQNPTKPESMLTTPQAPQKQQPHKDVMELNALEQPNQQQQSVNVIDHVPATTSSSSSSSSVAFSSKTTSQQRKDESNEKLIQAGNANKRSNKQSAGNKTGAAAAGAGKEDSNRKNEEERRRELAEEKRRQKEEKKRQHVEEEKRRLQQIEEEKRRQTLEEKERQQQIQAQRRKALLGINNSNNSGSSTTTSTAPGGGQTSGNNGTKKEQRNVQSSVAPWSIQTIAAATKSGPCLAEIQKAERRERADQQRQLELEKQMRANAAAAAETNDPMLKWNAPLMPVKSLAEIQAEEAKRLANVQHEMQRRKEQEQQQLAAAFTGGNSLSGGANAPLLVGSSSSIAAIWGGNKVWGAANNSSGFWEETHLKLATGGGGPTTNAGCNLTTAAAIVAAGLPSNNNTANASASKQAQPQGPQKIQTMVNLSASTGNSNTAAAALQQQQAGGGANASRNLRKSQTVSVMQNVNNGGGGNKNVKANSAQNQQQSGVAKPGSAKGQGQQQKGAMAAESGSAVEKKSGVKNQHNSGMINSTAGANKRDEYENEFTSWCTKSLNLMNAKVDVPTFVTFLQDLESPYEVKDYIRVYLGEAKEYTEFAKQFLERRSKYKNLQRAQNAHNDDMCKPAPAITPSSGNDNSDNKGKQKKVKKNKMTKLDARILGFSVTAAEGRINVGARDYVDAP